MVLLSAALGFAAGLGVGVGGLLWVMLFAAHEPPLVTYEVLYPTETEIDLEGAPRRRRKSRPAPLWL